MSEEDFENKILASIAKVIGLFILAVILYGLGYSNGKIKVLEDYKIECKVGTSTECFWIKNEKNE